jgi:hypothetical protein
MTDSDRFGYRIRSRKRQAGPLDPATQLQPYIDNILRAAFGSARYGVDPSLRGEIDLLQAIREDFFGARLPEPTPRGMAAEGDDHGGIAEQSADHRSPGQRPGDPDSEFR